MTLRSYLSRGPSREVLRWIPVAVVVTVLFVASYAAFVEDAPPSSIVLATGGERGQYHAYGRRYAAWLEETFRIPVDVRSTRGTGENLELLLDPGSGVAAGMVQGGVPLPEGAEGDVPLVSLGSLYREPLWIFHRGGERVDRLGQLAGKRLSIGEVGSGTFPVARTLLEANGIAAPDPGPDGTASDASTGTSFRFLGGAESARALREGAIDAAFVVVGIEAEYLRDLLSTPDVRVVSLAQWESYTRRFPFLSHVVLSRGLLDLGGDLPGEDVHLIAPTATLVVRDDLHPALASALVQAAYAAHRAGDGLSTQDEFPSMRYVDLPVSQDAELFYRNGPPLLQRWVGFHRAIWIDRVKFMILPLVMLGLPLFRAAPPIMRWRIRARIYRWYAVIRAADIALKSRVGVDVLRRHHDELARLAIEVADVRVPLSYMHEFYGMRFHLSLIQERLARELAERETADAAV